jgi:hypothetical protein
MPSYRVCFINEIPRNDKLFRCCQLDHHSIGAHP